MVGPAGIEPAPTDFQSAVRTSYTRVPLNCFGAPPRIRTGIQRILNPSALPISVEGHYCIGADGGIRTHTEQRLKLLTLPIGLHPLMFGAPGRNRTATPCLQDRTSTTKDTRAKLSVTTIRALTAYVLYHTSVTSV
jgi:hypothetical protein